MHFGIHEHILPGDSLEAKFTYAKALGFAGVELQFTENFDQRVAEIATAVEATGMQISTISVGMTRLLHPDMAERQRALSLMQQAIGCSIDMMAAGVVFYPFYQSGPTLPDLTPYKSSQELEFELLSALLRTSLVDLADALGTTLYVALANRSETHLLRKITHGTMLRESYRNHPRLKIAAHLYHMQIEGESPEDLHEHPETIGHLYLSTENGSLPISPSAEIEALARVLNGIQYDGWIILDTVPRTPQSKEALEKSIELVRTLLF